MFQSGYVTVRRSDRKTYDHMTGSPQRHIQRSEPHRCAAVLSMMFAVMFVSKPAFAQTGDVADTPCAPGELTCTDGDRVIYLPAFFSQYNPVTALDLVERVPGFSIDSGDNVRGFSGAAGNVLIDGQRPSTKSADIFDILRRIGAGTVNRIELIRGGTGGLDVGGQAVVVNVILNEGQAAGSSTTWELVFLKRRPNGLLRPLGNISHTGELRGVKYTIGANARGFGLRFNAEEDITRFFGDDETRLRDGEFREKGGGLNLNLEKVFGNGDIARFNVEASITKISEDITETRFPEVDGPDRVFFPFAEDEFEYEFGGDYEHPFSNNFDVKLIALYKRTFNDSENGFEFTPALGDTDQSLFISDQNIGETIGRIEFGWRGWSNHTIQFGGEVVHNFTDSAAQFFVDDGAGGLRPEMISGATTRVSELRAEPFVKDSWRVSPKLTVDMGFALELSEISQSGDVANARTFSYPKPSLALTYSPSSNTQWRLSGERVVGQLDFGDFISAVNFDDEDVDFGNPELQPEATWGAKLSFERRYGDIGVFRLTGFFDYINDVEDLLPLGGGVEVPGNIGDGTVLGATLDVTLPLDGVGLSNARLESSVTARKSSVVDPVTGLDREFTFRRPYFYEVSFRQDFPAYKSSWGWLVSGNDDEKAFGLDELTVFSNTLNVEAFVETTMIKGVKVRLEARDILNVTNTRDRTVFAGSRALGIVSFREFRESQNGGAIRLELSGTF